jgi:hypothetical protein
MNRDRYASLAPTSPSANGIQWFTPSLHEMRFLGLCAAMPGQEINRSQFGREAGCRRQTVGKTAECG